MTVKQNSNDIMPDKWRIPYKRMAYAGDIDTRTFKNFANGTITEQECIRSLENNNELESGTITHDMLMANLIWCGYWTVYTAHHKLSEIDVIIEIYFRDKRAELLSMCY